eukprot:gb/GECH01003021.1/.p1 GENE.gb/GECH01003021.1/~~gb/GECH01003021.1/.p1  ORF type:complete len:469 (+),score=75.21 gb/GECH01003021.1/:1-1407(+)
MVLPEWVIIKDGTWFTLLTFFVLWFIFVSILSVAMYQRRNHPYLKARSYNLMVLCIIGSAVSMISPGLFLLMGERYPCWATHIGSATSGYLILVPDLFRCIRLILMDRIGKEKSKLAESNNKEPERGEVSVDEKKQQRHLKRVLWMIRFTKGRYLFALYGILFVFHSIIYALFIGISPEERTITNCATEIKAVHATLTTFLYEIILLVLSVAIYRIREEFNIKRGIWITVILGTTAIILHGVWIFFVPMNVYVYFPDIAFYNVAIVLDVFNVGLFPLLRSYSKRYQTLEFMKLADMENDPSAELETVLNNSEASNLFLEYCKCEFSSENYYFWCDAKRFKSLCQRDRHSKAAEIVFKYMSEDSVLNINISAATRSSMSNTWNHYYHQYHHNNNTVIDETFFDEAMEQCKRNMLDTFLRFRRSVAWQEYQQKLANERDAYKELLPPKPSESTQEQKEQEDDETSEISEI